MSAVFGKLVAGGSAALIPVGALCALFVHAHLDDHDTSHHHGHQVHAHFSEHQATHVRYDHNTTTIDHDDTEETIDIQVFVAVSADPQIVPAPPSAPYAIAMPSTPAPRPMRQVTHGKDPPLLLAHLGPRPPPAASL